MNTHIQTRLTYQHIMQIKSRQQRRRRALLISIGLLVGFVGGFAVAHYVRAQTETRIHLVLVVNNAEIQPLQLVGTPCTDPPTPGQVCLRTVEK